jgi:ATP-dependent Clp protease ATP-binding subunit ClpA
VNQIFSTFKVDRAPILRAVQRILEEMPAGNRGRPAVSPKLVELLQAGLVLSEDAGLENIRAGMLILAYALNPGHTRVGEFTPELERIDTEQLRNHFDEMSAGRRRRRAAGEGGRRPRRSRRTWRWRAPISSRWISAKAAAGRSTRVSGAIPRFADDDIFARRRKNTPILVGEPHGQDAVVEGLRCAS